MNDVSKQLLTLARKNLAAYIAISKARAIGVAGSVARRQADIYSDIAFSRFMGCKKLWNRAG
ncbi:hypothetical protein [Nostoc sp. UHCC 0302]|uniref:hypothetical protein n=1 Tax=Nostoc sp. UHCC 0302 TaxID=3134896 RepID=UPI00311C94DC